MQELEHPSHSPLPPPLPTRFCCFCCCCCCFPLFPPASTNRPSCFVPVGCTKRPSLLWAAASSTHGWKGVMNATHINANMQYIHQLQKHKHACTHNLSTSYAIIRARLSTMHCRCVKTVHRSKNHCCKQYDTASSMRGKNRSRRSKKLGP